MKSGCELDEQIITPEHNSPGSVKPDKENAPVDEVTREICHVNRNSTRLDVTPTAKDTPNPITNMSLLGGISHIWGIAKNISLFGVLNNNHNDLDETEFTLNISLPDIDATNINIDLGPQDLPLLELTRVNEVDESEGDMSNSSDEGFRTPTKSPFSPKSRSPSGNTITFLTVSKTRSGSLSGRSRTRSESGTKGSRPYNKPPAIVLRKRLLSRIAFQGGNDTPLSKHRSRSESDVISEPSQEVESPKINSSFACSQIRTEGYHSCGPSSIHLSHDLLSSCSKISKVDIVLAIQKLFQNAINPFDHTVFINWSDGQCLVTQGNGSANVCDDCPILEFLMSIINEHISIVSGKLTSFDGLKITSMPDRSTRLPIEEKSAISSGTYQPTAILHLGKDRSLDIIPKRFDPSMKDVFDVQLGNFSVLTILPEAQKAMTIYLPQETVTEENEADHHIIITPTLSEQTKIAAADVLLGKRLYDNPENQDNLHAPLIECIPNTENEMKKNSRTKSVETELESVISLTTTDYIEATPQIEPENANQDVTEPTHTNYATKCVGEKEHHLRENLETLATDVIENNVINEIEDMQDVPVKSESQSKTPEHNNISVEVGIQSSHKSLAEIPEIKDLFISSARCVDIVNSQNSETIKDWLRKCNLIAAGTVQSNRALLLNFLQSANEGAVFPPQTFVDLFLKKILGQALDEELSYKKVTFIPSSAVVYKRRLLLEKLNEIRITITKNDTPIRKVSLPSLMQNTESDSGSQSSDPESDSDVTYYPPNARLDGQKAKIKLDDLKKSPRRKPVQKPQKTKKSTKTSSTENLSANPGSSETCLNKYEKSIKTLECTVLKLQERIENQDLAIEQMNIKLNENNSLSPSLSPVSKTIKKLETKIHTLFETNNHQQTCIDELMESLEKQAKTDKWLRDKLTQWKGDYSQKTIEFEDALKSTNNSIHNLFSSLSNTQKELDGTKNDLLHFLQNVSPYSTQQHNFQVIHAHAMKPVLQELVSYTQNCKERLQAEIRFIHNYSSAHERHNIPVFFSDDIPVFETISVSFQEDIEQRDQTPGTQLTTTVFSEIIPVPKSYPSGSNSVNLNQKDTVIESKDLQPTTSTNISDPSNNVIDEPLDKTNAVHHQEDIRHLRTAETKTIPKTDAKAGQKQTAQQKTSISTGTKDNKQPSTAQSSQTESNPNIETVGRN